MKKAPIALAQFTRDTSAYALRTYSYMRREMVAEHSHSTKSTPESNPIL